MKSRWLLRGACLSVGHMTEEGEGGRPVCACAHSKRSHAIAGHAGELRAGGSITEAPDKASAPQTWICFLARRVHEWSLMAASTRR
jgi:hypothetical protein